MTSDYARTVDWETSTAMIVKYKGWHIGVGKLKITSPPVVEFKGREVELMGVTPETIREEFELHIFKSKDFAATMRAEESFNWQKFDTAEDALAMGKRWIDEEGPRNK